MGTEGSKSARKYAARFLKHFIYQNYWIRNAFYAYFLIFLMAPISVDLPLYFSIPITLSLILTGTQNSENRAISTRVSKFPNNSTTRLRSSRKSYWPTMQTSWKKRNHAPQPKKRNLFEDHQSFIRYQRTTKSIGKMLPQKIHAL